MSRCGTAAEMAGKMAGKIRVLLADDHAMFRQGIKEMLSTDDLIEVVGEAKNGREAVALAENLQPDVVLLDVEMPVMGAKPAMERMMATDPAPRVVIVTMYDDPRLVRELIGLGAIAYLVKSATIEELLAAVHEAVQSTVGPHEGAVMVAPATVLREPEDAYGLSEREMQVLLLAARGMNNRRISAELYISESTVKRHLANIYPRIQVNSRGEAVTKALSEGWIHLHDITDREDVPPPPQLAQTPVPNPNPEHGSQDQSQGPDSSKKSSNSETV